MNWYCARGCSTKQRSENQIQRNSSLSSFGFELEHEWFSSVLLVSWSVICCQDSCFMVRQRRIAEKYLSHNLDEHYLQDTRMTWSFLPKWGGTIIWALRFLARVVREIDFGDWLARGHVPAHQHCELFFPPAGDLIGSVLN